MRTGGRRAARSSQLDFHKGKALLTLANTYPTLTQVLLEIVQNALDAAATRVYITVNWRERSVRVQDNGDGASIDDFEQAMSQVGMTMKAVGKLGRFGLGLISPLGKCATFTFTSRPRKSSDDYLEWTFVTKNIEDQHSYVRIPRRIRPDLRGRGRPNWSSEFMLRRITDDRVISRISLDELEASINENYDRVLKRNKVNIRVEVIDANGKTVEERRIKAKPFTGRRLREFVVEERDAGKVSFQLYLVDNSPKGRKGKILVGEMGDDFRFPLRYVFQSMGELFTPEVLAVLRSGTFAGEITAEKVSLNSSRKSFEKNAALTGLCVAIEEWYEKEGSRLYKDAQESKQEARYQDLGLRSLRKIEDLLRKPEFAGLLKVIEGFRFGTQGIGHYETPKKESGDQLDPSISTHGARVPKETNGQYAGRGPQNPPKKEYPQHVPGTVVGPEGVYRRRVRRNSFGLQFSYYATDSEKIWELDITEGRLNFNVRHPLWVICSEKADRHVMRLQEFLAIQALTLYSMPDHMAEHQRVVVDALVEPYVHLILADDPARRAREARKQVAKT